MTLPEPLMTTKPIPLGQVAHDVLTALAQADPHHGRWHTGAEAARADLRRLLATDDPTTAITTWLARQPTHNARTVRAGYRAMQATAQQLLEEQHMPTTPDTRATEKQLRESRALEIDCPYCHSPADRLCTSHSGTRVRHHDIHQARRDAWKKEAGTADA